MDGVNLGGCHNGCSSYRISLSNDMLCAGGEEGKDSCHGDSGT